MTTLGAGAAPAQGARLRGNLVAAGSMAVWATAFPATEIMLRDWSPLPLATARLLVAGLTMLLVVRLSGRWAELVALPWRRALVMGGVGIGASVGLMVVGQALSGTIMTAIVTAMMPVFAAAYGLLHGERLSGRLGAGILLAVAGGLLAGALPAGSGVAPGWGVLALVASNMFWVWASRGLAQGLGPAGDATRSCAGLLSGTLVLGLLSILGAASGLLPARLSTGMDDLLLLLWIGCVAVGLSFPMWLAAVRALGMTVAAMHGNLVPFYVMLLAVLAGGGVGERQIMGAALVAAGAILAQLPARRAAGG